MIPPTNKQKNPALSHTVSTAYANRHAVVYQQLWPHLLEHLDGLQIEPRVILELGSKLDLTRQTLHTRFPNAQLISANTNLNPTMHSITPPLSKRWYWPFRKRNPVSAAVSTSAAATTHRVALHPHQLPFTAQSVDLIVSHLFLPWLTDWPTLLSECLRVLSPQGLLLVSLFGGNTLTPFAQALVRSADKNKKYGARAISDNTAHTNDALQHRFQMLQEGLGIQWTDIHTLGNTLMQTGFGQPVIDQEQLTIRYRSWQQLLREIRATRLHHDPAFHHLLSDNNTHRTHNRINSRTNKMYPPLSQLLRLFDGLDIRDYSTVQDYSTDDLRDSTHTLDQSIELTVEVIYAHAWGRDARAYTKQRRSGVETIVPINKDLLLPS